MKIPEWVRIDHEIRDQLVRFIETFDPNRPNPGSPSMAIDANETKIEQSKGTVYDALVAALEHERACYADWQDTGSHRSYDTRYERWVEAKALVRELRAKIQKQE